MPLLAILDPTLHGPLFALFLMLAHQAKPDPEASQTRERLIQAIHEHPGVTPTQLADSFGLALPTIIYHLRLIVAAGRVTIVRMGRTMHCFPFLSGVPHSRRDAAAIAANESARRVALLLMEDPYLTSSEIAARLGVTRQAINKQILRIRKARLLFPVQDEACRLGWAPVECLRQILTEHHPESQETESA